MAAYTLKRCLGAVKVIHKCGSHRFIARRCLLSTAYTDTKLWDAREKDHQNLALLATLMDRTYDRNFPVSSLSISRFVDNISSREEVDQAEYYLYKFRHSPNCWYLRDWTVHSWVRQCLRYGARDKALHTLKNKVQYGMFPDDFTFNILIDSFIKDEDFKGACSVVEEVMLQESFDLPTTQILSLYALSNYLATKPELSMSDERALGASLLISGLKQDGSIGLSAQLLGCALLGKVEMAAGIHAVFRGMPLMWTPGYLGRALAVMERVAAAPGDGKLSKDAVDYLEGLLQDLSSASDSSSGEDDESGGEEGKKEEEEVDEDDQAERDKLPLYASRFKDLSGQLQSRGKVDPSPLQVLVSSLVQQSLASAEGPDMEQYQRKVGEWEAERQQLIRREKEMRERAEEERRAHQAAKAAAMQG
ncbi:small ribosomal subunit protein mS27 [Salmo salar]|uniref:Small ribosomal subunit protein mS27 n=1 Tax=Salmo salar TaxID=8030 RepID=A0A1S3PG45_SALSA|nr:28S ribosomal protein S27, mitochondrial [Salmo salar]|eukprot:XP_014026576.1 PREDICTED: 28S ribosomal protein S27, mitochondrial [Salmo salar]